MKVIVNKSDLRDAINAVMPAVAVKPSTPVTAGIFFRAETSGLTVRATNFQLDITAKIPANVETAGETVTTGKFLQPIVNKLNGDIVTLADSGSKLAVKSEAASFDLLTMDASDFPKPASDEHTDIFRISGAALRKLIAQTAFACGDDQTRPAFTGVHFEVNGTQIRAAGTNAHRIAIVSDEICDAAAADVIIPAATLRAIAPALGSQIVTVEIFPSAVAFDFDNLHIVSRLIDGSFPNVGKVIPASFATRAVIDAAELKAAIERIQIIARADEYKTANFTFTADGLEITSNAQGIGRAIEHVDAEVTGADINIAFNFAYVLDALKIIGGKIEFGINDNLKPALLKAPSNPDFIYVITPLRTR